MKINIRILIMFFLVFLLYAVGKVFFNDADPKAGFQTSMMQYYYAFSSLMILMIIFFRKKNKYKYPFFGLIKYSFIYYIFALFSSIYSNIFILTAYNSVIGGFYVIASIVLAQTIYLERRKFLDQMKTFFNLLLFLIFSMIFANMYFYFTYKGQTDFLTKGVEAGFPALLGIYYLFVKFIHTSRLFKKIKLFVISPIILKLNSTSAILSFFPIYFYYLFNKKKYIQILMVGVLIGIFGIYFINLLKSGIGELVINNKPAEAYLSGSGRFELYITAYDSYINEYSILEKLFGIGYAAERSMLVGKGLPWITDPHNAIILSVMGMGIIGLLIYLAFVIYPFILLKKVRKYTKNNTVLVQYTYYWVYLHYLFTVFSMTGSYYIGKPSMLLIVSLVFNYLLYMEYKNTRRVKCLKK